MRTRLLLVLSALLLVTALFLWLRPQPFPVEVAVADRGPVRVELRGEGETRARTGTHDEVSAPFPGAWIPAPLEVGDRVRRGQRLGALAPVPLDGTARAAALERVQSADANAREAQDALARGERLFEAGALSTEGLQHLRTAQVAAASELASARAALGRGEEVTVRSPLSGWVLRAPEPHARTVNAGALLFEVGDPAALDVIVDLRTEDAVAVRPGAAAELRPSPDAPPIGATVERVEPSAFTEVSPLGFEEQRVNLV
ncbi:MAG TPA: HlyD family efflux transporter periplasmic adaptor subunit, partial [Gemmatimonadales bacterium]|nr:HlyD family efflux transporter periplasmic adaptor subunit [Gemmatimonadales bacterium]